LLIGLQHRGFLAGVSGRGQKDRGLTFWNLQAPAKLLDLSGVPVCQQAVKFQVAAETEARGSETQLLQAVVILRGAGSYRIK